MAIFLMLRSGTAQQCETNAEHVVPTETGSRFLEVFQQTARAFSVQVEPKCSSSLFESVIHASSAIPPEAITL
jgi:hypothetical protein